MPPSQNVGRADAQEKITDMMATRDNHGVITEGTSDDHEGVRVWRIGARRRTRWAQHKAQIEACCGAGWYTTEELQRALCDAQVHTQHKALKSYVGRHPQLRARVCVPYWS